VRDGVPTLSLNPPLFGLLSAGEQEALLEHLIKHLLHLHPLRRKERNQHDWDVCCDLAVNPTVQGLPDNALMPDMYGMETGLAAEEYYDALVPPFDTGNLEGSGYGDDRQDTHGAGGQGQADIQDAATLDDHEIWSDADSTPLPLAEEMMRVITRDSLRGSDGDIPEDVRCVVDGLLQPSPINWRQILRQFMATAGRIGRTSTWMREHRRFGQDTPGNRKRRRLNLLVGIDVSDSTDIIRLREAFAKELLQISRGRDAHITVLYANSRVQRIEAFNSSSCVVQRYEGGGFTDLRPVFEYGRGMQPLPAAVIYLTDGIGPVPEEMAFPTLWVLTSDGEKPAPWGIELRLEV
jgi:predicted metal-dependent peptidase